MSSKKHMLQAAAGAGGADSYWIALLGGTGNDFGQHVAIDSSGDIVVAGYTYSVGAGDIDALIVKYDSSGALQWSRTLGGTLADSFSGVAIDSSDNIIAVGYTQSDGAGQRDVLIAKYNSSGTLQWDRTLGTSGNDYGQAVAIDSSDNIIVGAFTGYGGGTYSCAVAVYNSSGSLQWKRALYSSANDFVRGITVDSSDNIILCGSEGSQGNYYMFLAKYSPIGALQWQQRLGGSGTDQAYSVAVDSSGDIIVFGDTGSDGAGSADFLLAKYNSSGTLQWDRTLGGTGTENGYSVALDSSDNIIVTGRTASDGEGGYDIFIGKYDSSGTLEWQKTLGGSTNDMGWGIVLDSSDNIIITGYTLSDGAGGYDLLLAKLPSDGTGDGTYGSLVYQDAVLTDAEAVLTSAYASLTDTSAVLTDAAAVLTDSSVSLTEELFEVTP